MKKPRASRAEGSPLGRLVYVVVCSAIVIAFLFGLRTFVYSMGTGFVEGSGFGAMLMVLLLLAYRRWVGPID